MAWYDATHNPQVISGYYSSPLALDQLELLGLSLHGADTDSPVLRLSLLLPVYPDKPSKRWHPDTNAAELGLDLWCPAGVCMEGWSGPVIGTFSLQQVAPQKLMFGFQSPATSLQGTCVAARISGISGYVRRCA
jgi:hypothetical protein